MFGFTSIRTGEGGGEKELRKRREKGRGVEHRSLPQPLAHLALYRQVLRCYRGKERGGGTRGKEREGAGVSCTTDSPPGYPARGSTTGREKRLIGKGKKKRGEKGEVEQSRTKH